MIAHALLTLYRTLMRHRLYAALNVFGLAAGIAVFLVLMLVVRYECGFDRWLPHADKVYRLDTTWFSSGIGALEGANSSFIALDLLRADYPQIEAGTRVMTRSAPVSVDRTIDSESVSYVDPDFFRVLELPLVAGDPAHALAEPGSVVVTQSIARKYFGTEEVFGKSLTIAQNGTKRSFTVSAVIKDLPRDTMLKFSLVTVFTPAVTEGVYAFRRWGSSSGETYLHFRNTADAVSVASDLGAFIKRRVTRESDDEGGDDPRDSMALSLVALPDAHFHDIHVDPNKYAVDPRVVFSLGAVGALALLIAVINYVNLATARSGLRAREVALRKVMGATRRMLLVQFLGEAVVLVALAAVIGLALTELALPVVNALGGWDVRIDYLIVVPLLVALVLIVGLGAGAYPALLLAAYRPAAVLASTRAPSGGRMGTRLRNLLVLAQFTAAIGFAASTLVIDAQARFLREADRGFERQGLIIVKSLAANELLSRQTALVDSLRRVPGVVAATLSDREPDSNMRDSTNVTLPGHVGPDIDLVNEIVGRDYFRTYGIRLIAGRLFDEARVVDDLAGRKTGVSELSTVINRRAVAALGFKDPQDALGHTMSSYAYGTGKLTLTIVGVVEDVRFMSPREPVAPQFYIYDSGAIDFAQAALRFSGVPRAELMPKLQAAWLQVAPDNPLVAATADERLADFYEPDENRARLFSAGAVLAIGIACVGLYGLAAFNTARRVKEIGIRKTLGASTRDVLLLLIGQFVQPVLVANLIAWPVAWMAMRAWLAGFDQRIALSPLYFLVVTVAALALAMLTVSGQVIRVARAEPAKALRYE